MITPWFITGFSEGEGAFTYSRSGKSLGLYFAIKLTEEDSGLIDLIYDFFNVGRIYRVKSREPSHRSGNTRAAIYYRVTKISELAQIVQHFDKYPLQGKKSNAYKIWREMVCLKSKFRKPDIPRLNELAAELSKLTTKSPIRNIL